MKIWQFSLLKDVFLIYNIIVHYILLRNQYSIKHFLNKLPFGGAYVSSKHKNISNIMLI